jgi:PTH2 family peptidyl-tRNA hydrolase
MQDTTTQPSTANIAVACAIVAGVTGYMLGQAKSLGLFGGSPISTPAQGKEKAAEDSEESSDDDEEEDDSVPADFKGNNEECKMVLVVRTDLGMTKGIGCCAYTRVALIDGYQARLGRNADTRHWPATSTSSATHRTRQYYDDGNIWARQRWLCRSRARRSWNSCRHKR